MRTAIVLGTRPEIIKMSPVIREYKKRGLEYFVIHTGQHYSYEMDEAFFRDLKLEASEVNLMVGSGSHGIQTGKILAGVEEFIKDDCDLVLVQGDTNTVAGGSLAAAKLNIPVGHVEAGLRSYDKSMPEEINRIIADHVSTFLFAPTDVSKKNLLREGINDSLIYVVGNTVVDALNQNIEIAKKEHQPLEDLNIEDKAYYLATCHRAENADDPTRLNEIIQVFREISCKYDLPIVYPVHPRTKKMINRFDIDTTGLMIIPPVGYLDFILLEQGAKLILTDSGGVQEEACIIQTPCVTIRDNTERPETVEVGSNIIAGTSRERILECVEIMLDRKKTWKNPFGDGKTAKKIVEITNMHLC